MGIFNGIVQQIAQHFTQTEGIGIHHFTTMINGRKFYPFAGFQRNFGNYIIK